MPLDGFDEVEGSRLEWQRLTQVAWHEADRRAEALAGQREQPATAVQAGDDSSPLK
jgi:hypothetical protein